MGMLCGECWIDEGEVICLKPEEHLIEESSKLPIEEQLDLFEDQ